jgi:pectate lyase
VSACKTITYALTQATASDTINVAAGTYSAANGETLPLVPTVDVTINGAGASSTFIDGGSTTRVMTVNSGRNITLQNVTIQNGRGLLGGNCGAFLPAAAGCLMIVAH